MELRHLRYFVAVADELSFTRGAEKLHLTQPSLTRQIHDLEDELGVGLLDRTKNRVTLTEEGKSFLTDARRLIAMSLESIKSVQLLSRVEACQLNLGYLFKFNFDLLPATLTALYQKHPEIAVNLFDMTPAEQLLALESRNIDLGFVGLRPSIAAKSMAGLAWECVAHHAVVAVLPARHQLAKNININLADLKTLFFVAMSEQKHPGSREWLCSLCKEAGFIPRILQEVDLESGIMTFVAEGLGVTLAREQIKNLPHPGVVFRRLARPLNVDYWVAWHGENHAQALSQYLETIKNEVTNTYKRDDHNEYNTLSILQGKTR